MIDKNDMYCRSSSPVHPLSLILQEDVVFVEFFDIFLDIGKLSLEVFLPGLESESVNESNITFLLIFTVEFFPFLLQSVSEFPDFIFAEAVPKNKFIENYGLCSYCLWRF